MYCMHMAGTFYSIRKVHLLIKKNLYFLPIFCKHKNTLPTAAADVRKKRQTDTGVHIVFVVFSIVAAF